MDKACESSFKEKPNMPAKEKVVEKIEQKNGKEEQNAFMDAARKVLLAGIGAFALAQEEVEDFVNRLIERGEIAEKDGRKLVREVMEKRKKDAEKAEDEITKRVESVMERMSVPSKADIEALSEKITTLTKKIEELKKA
jgi:poly(hydroxyalkanoate) granule-associated protein